MRVKIRGKRVPQNYRVSLFPSRGDCGGTDGEEFDERESLGAGLAARRFMASGAVCIKGGVWRRPILLVLKGGAFGRTGIMWI